MAENLRVGIAAVLAAAFMLALVLPIPALAEDADTDLVLREVEEQMDRLREWVNDRLAELEPREEKPRPLGKTVSLTFALEGTGRSTTILTAMSTYMVSTQGSESSAEEDVGHETSEMAFNAVGTIFIDEAQEGMLVTCTGAFMVVKNAAHEGSAESDETTVNFHTSALFRPGDAHVIASQNGLSLVLAVNIVPED